MLRTPAPKAQAKLLVTLLAERGIALPNQQSLEVVAKLAGHRNWNVMQAALKSDPKPVESADKKCGAKPMPDAARNEPAASSSMDVLRTLREAAHDVVENADNCCCSGDLTVTSESAVKRLNNALRLLTSSLEGGNVGIAPSVMGFGAADVQSVRPDLNHNECAEVLAYCERNFDASRGLNWDLIEAFSFECFPYAKGAIVTLVAEDGPDVDGIVSFYNGQLFQGGPEELGRSAQGDITAVTANHRPISYSEIRFSNGTLVDLDGCSELCGGVTDCLAELRDELCQAGVVLIDVPRLLVRGYPFA